MPMCSPNASLSLNYMGIFSYVFFFFLFLSMHEFHISNIMPSMNSKQIGMTCNKVCNSDPLLLTLDKT